MIDSKLPERKPTRWSEIDYSTAGLYFVTICTRNREQILSHVSPVGDGASTSCRHPVCTTPVGDGLNGVGEGFPLPHLTAQGKITQKYIKAINPKYPHISVDAYTIMPNHIHLILIVGEHDGRGDPSPTVSSAVGWLKYHVTKEINAVFKTKGQKIFQRSFYDHVIRNGREYDEIAQYIATNPQNWQNDSLYC